MLEGHQGPLVKRMQEVALENLSLKREIDIMKCTTQVIERELSNQRTEKFSRGLGNLMITPGADISPIKNSVRTIVDRLQYLDSQFVTFQNKISDIEKFKT